MATIWATFGRNLGNFWTQFGQLYNSNIWSHWSRRIGERGILQIKFFFCGKCKIDSKWVSKDAEAWCSPVVISRHFYCPRGLNNQNRLQSKNYLGSQIYSTYFPLHVLFKMGHSRPPFGLFSLNKKMYTLAGFELGSSEYVANALTLRPEARPFT